jgi:PAS domain S-box-containing protein
VGKTRLFTMNRYSEAALVISGTLFSAALAVTCWVAYKLSIAHNWPIEALVIMAAVLAGTGLTLLVCAIALIRSAIKTEVTKSHELSDANAALSESKQMFDSFMLHTPAIAWVKSPDGKIIWANRNFYKSFHLKPEQVIGKRADEFLSQSSEEIDRVDRHVIEDNSSVEHIMPLHLSRDTAHYFFISKFPVHSSQGDLIGAIAIDVNKQFLAEEQIKQLNAQLREHVKQLEIARDKALESSALKSAFVANISHEIRTPLSGILGMNELLLGSELNTDQRILAETVHESSLSLLTVLNDILDLSKIEAGKMSFEYAPFNLPWVVQDSIRLMSAAAGAKNIALNVQFDDKTPKSVVGDSERLRQVLLNLIGNAVKFTQKGGITVEVRVERETADEFRVRFSVKDTGIGISAEDRKYLFVPFAQVDNSSTRRVGGTGLGLTICKKLVNGMGGEIGVESEQGVGSTFSFSLPLRKPGLEAAPKPASHTGPRRTNAHKWILVVEDNPVLQSLAVVQLNNLGISSQVARSGEEAIKLASEARFDLILMDLNLPTISGFDATKRIREMEKAKGKRTPIVAMTAGTTQSDRQRAMQSGMDDYLTKPVSIDALRRMIEKWTGDGNSMTA